jgi:16S rRNA (cytosine967-C5)-methyltransferase
VGADAPGAGGHVDAADLHGAKLERLQDEALRLGVRVGRCYEIDASVGRGAIEEGGYDRVLIDAPCSGIGTLRRRPEIILRRAEASVAELQTLQRAILRTIAPAVKPGGTLIYAVCSVLVEECEEVVRDLPGFELLSVRRLLPHREGSDGYAFATLRAQG